MAKPIIVNWQGKSSSFQLAKLDRSKLYGKRQRWVLDPEGKRCERAELMRDGSMLIRSGMTAQGYFDDDGTWIRNDQLVGLNEAGEPVEKVQSTLGAEQPLEGPLDPSDVLDVTVRSVYMLSPEELDDALKERLLAGDVFRCAFNYRADFNAETALLLVNDDGYFALVGDPLETRWFELAVAVNETDDDAADDDDELDFEMF